VNCERCAAPSAHADADPHAHEHSHAHGQAGSHSHAHGHAPLIPDYSRQIALKEVGAAGQAKLRSSRVLVVGCGGLGVPVISYLSGAGIGRLGLVDGDKLEPSNLHRQTLYALADVGKPKAQLAAERVRSLNPDVHVQTHLVRLDAQSARDIVSQYDLVIDCTDNFSTKFMLNDVCVQLAKPVIFSSVYQYEGQLQVVRPDKAGACLRCVWPEATRDGIVGNCSEAGVLGPVPGVFGTLQALEALKILLNLPGQLGDEMWVMDLLTMSSSRVRAKRASDCPDHAARSIAGTGGRVGSSAGAGTSAVSALSPENIELEFDTLDDALNAGFEIIDIREAKEIVAAPLPSSRVRNVPMAEVLYGKSLLSGKTLLVCASGRRSLATSRDLRARGVPNVFSLKGGVQALLRSAKA
jgi:adenylyltransferase/sulfurtransferase